MVQLGSYNSPSYGTIPIPLSLFLFACLVANTFRDFFREFPPIAAIKLRLHQSLKLDKLCGRDNDKVWIETGRLK